MSEYINIAIALNENVIMPAYVMVHSLAVNQREPRYVSMCFTVS